MKNAAAVKEALERLRAWTLSQPPAISPENTFAIWLAIALRECGACGVRQLLAEAELREDDLRVVASARTKMFANGRGRIALRYDLAIVSPDGQSAHRLGSSGPLDLLVELKAANSAGSLTRGAVTRDMRKLAIAAEWHEARHGFRPSCLMVLLATALDRTKKNEGRSRHRLNLIRGWHDGLLEVAGMEGIWLATVDEAEVRLDQCERPA